MAVGTMPPRIPEPGQTLRLHRSFPGRSDELRHVRRWLAELLPAGPVREDVLSIAVELASNAVRHTATGMGGRFTVEVSWHDRPGAVRICVADDGSPHV